MSALADVAFAPATTTFYIGDVRTGKFLLAPWRRGGRACHAHCVALRCLIVDDSQSYLEAAAALLEREGASVLGVTSTSEDALLQARRLVPDVVLVDIILRGESGLDLARRLAELEPPRPAVILISAHSESDFAELIGETPVAGFLPKADLSTRAIQKLVDGV